MSLPAARAPRRAGSPAGTAVRRAGLLALAAWWLAPLVPVVVWSVADRWTYPALLPQRWGLTGWATVLEDGAGSAVLRSAGLGVVVAAVATPLGALAGRGLAGGRVTDAGSGPRGRAGAGRILLAAAVVLPIAVPPFATVLGLTSLVLRWHVPTVAALVAVLVAAALPYTTWVMQARWTGYDHGLEDAARTLGATPVAVLLRVRLPALAPGLAVAGFLAFLVAWGDYVATLVLAAGRIRTLQQLLGATAAGSGTEPAVAALAVLTLAPALLLLAVVARLDRTGAAQ